MRYLARWTFVISMLLTGAILGGCSATVPIMPKQYDVAAERFQPRLGNGNIYVVRERANVGSAAVYKIDLDGSTRSQIANGTYHLIELAPGQHVISVTTKESTDQVDINVVAGKNYFVELVPTMGVFAPRASVVRINEARGKRLVVSGERTAPLEGIDVADILLKDVDIGTIGPVSTPEAPLYISSDEIHHLRTVEKEQTLVLGWEKHKHILEEDSTVESSNGTLRLGQDYFELEESGKRTLYDLALRRIYSYTPNESIYTNDSMFVPVALRDMEAINRAFLGTVFEGIKAAQEITGHQQFWFEAELNMSARNLPPLVVERRTPNKDTVTVHWEGETAASFRLGELALDPRHAEVLARALRYIIQIHPAALSEALPFNRIPIEITSLHSYLLDKKARTTVTFSVIGEKTVPFPLPKGLKAKIHRKGDSEAVRRILEAGISAINGTWGKGPLSLEDYAADAATAEVQRDPLGTILPWLVASIHYPNKIDACDDKSPPEFCSVYHRQRSAVINNDLVQAIGQASAACAQGNNELGVRKLMAVDVDNQKHGYFVNMILSCLLRGMSPDAIKEFGSIGAVSHGALGNAILAIEGNPYVPSFYADIGNMYAQDYRTGIAWRMFDIGRALGGGVPGDAFDQQVSPNEKQLLGLYPEFF